MGEWILAEGLQDSIQLVLSVYDSLIFLVRKPLVKMLAAKVVREMTRFVIGYLDDGSPVFSLEAIADKLGVSPEEAEKSFQEMVAVRQELGLPIDGVITDLGKVHRRQ